MPSERKLILDAPEFLLHLRDAGKTRTARLNPVNHELRWSDDGGRVFAAPGAPVAVDLEPAFAVSPLNPGLKMPDPAVIKIQVGLGCNMSCEYCSQREIRPGRAAVDESLRKAREFMVGVDKWYRGGAQGDGEGTRVELWGGETLIYWDAVSELAREFRSRYPKVLLHFFTNGSMLTPEIIDAVDQLGIHVTISHDGPFSARTRGRDVLADPRTLAQIRELFRRLNSRSRITFNATITRESPNLLEIHRYIAERLEVPFEAVRVSHEIGIPYSSESVKLFGDASLDIRTRLVRNAVADGVHGLLACSLWEPIQEVRELLANPVHRDVFGQRCGMDRADRLAVDLDGNVLTCQITSAESGHRIGAVDRLEEARLTTSRHWSLRDECVSCPVLMTCRGGCMFMTEKTWSESCDQLFDWHLGYLAAALFQQTGMILERIEGAVVRGARGSGSTSVEVLRYKDFLDVLSKSSAQVSAEKSQARS